MENYLQQLDNLNRLVEAQQARTTIWSLIHQYSGLFLVAGLLLLVVSLFTLASIGPVLNRMGIRGVGGAIEGMLFCGIFFTIGLYGIADMFVYPIVTPAHEQLGITEESYTNIINTIADMSDDEYNALIKSTKTYKLPEKQQDEYKVALKMLNIKRQSK